MAATAVDEYHEEGRKRTYADAFESVVWDWCDISSRYCTEKSYQHVWNLSTSNLDSLGYY